MASGVERFGQAARERGLDLDVRTWPQGTRTAEDAAAAVGCDVGQIVKSLVFVADGEPVVALTSGANRVDTARLAEALAVEGVRKADADEVRDATGYAIGGTPPFGYPLRVLMDADLLAHNEVWAAAGTPDTTFPIDPETLRDAAQATVAEFTEG
jgi:prolyl-tRNA editing enzyme YbaK/EbsC (Cys-tRNA(Pro) deacylase)